MHALDAHSMESLGQHTLSALGQLLSAELATHAQALDTQLQGSTACRGSRHWSNLLSSVSTCAPSSMACVQVAADWERLTAHIEADEESKRQLGWVREMYAFSIATALQVR